MLKLIMNIPILATDLIADLGGFYSAIAGNVWNLVKKIQLG